MEIKNTFLSRCKNKRETIVAQSQVNSQGISLPFLVQGLNGAERPLYYKENKSRLLFIPFCRQ